MGKNETNPASITYTHMRKNLKKEEKEKKNEKADLMTTTAACLPKSSTSPSSLSRLR